MTKVGCGLRNSTKTNKQTKKFHHLGVLLTGPEKQKISCVAKLFSTPSMNLGDLMWVLSKLLDHYFPMFVLNLKVQVSVKLYSTTPTFLSWVM